MFKEKDERRECGRPLRSWLEDLTDKKTRKYRFPFRRPPHLTAADADDVMGEFWLAVVEKHLLERVVPKAYIKTIVWNIIRKRSRTLGYHSRAEAHEHVRLEEHEAPSYMAARLRHDRSVRLERIVTHWHYRALTLSNEGHQSDEVARLVTKERPDRPVGAAAVRQWRARDLKRLEKMGWLRAV